MLLKKKEDSKENYKDKNNDNLEEGDTLQMSNSFVLEDNKSDNLHSNFPKIIAKDNVDSRINEALTIKDYFE